MSKQIWNTGVEGGILKIIKDDGGQLTPDQEKYLATLESLPKNQWNDLDSNGNPISKEQAAENTKEHLSHFKPINNENY